MTLDFGLGPPAAVAEPKKKDRNRDLWLLVVGALIALGLQPGQIPHTGHTRGTPYDELVDLLYRYNLETYRLALMQEVLQAGGDAALVAVTNAEVLAEIRAAAEWSAQSIVATLSTDLATMIAAAPADIEAGDLGRLIEQWVRARASWKADQVARTEVGHTMQRAQQDFIRYSEATGTASFRDSLQCALCKAIAANNPYDMNDPIVGTHPHPSCLDSWYLTIASIVRIWTGD